jgi:hypothetical protein
MVPYRKNSTMTLPAGLYPLCITSRTSCAWTFTIISTGDNAAGIAPVQMFWQTKNGLEDSETASLRDVVEF